MVYSGEKNNIILHFNWTVLFWGELMKSTYVGTRSANVGDIQCLFALASDSTSYQ